MKNGKSPLKMLQLTISKTATYRAFCTSVNYITHFHLYESIIKILDLLIPEMEQAYRKALVALLYISGIGEVSTNDFTIQPN